MIVVGLTGGIATGKTLVSNIFSELGAYIIDADILSRRVVEPSKPAYQEIVNTFSKDILLKDGSIDRKKLGDIVFSDSDKLKILEDIIHPRVIEEQESIISSLREDGSVKIVIVDAALLIESGYYKKTDKVIVVVSTKEKQVERLIKRVSLTQKIALDRVSCQMSTEDRVKFADFVIDNNNSIGNTKQQITDIVRKLQLLYQ